MPLYNTQVVLERDIFLLSTPIKVGRGEKVSPHQQHFPFSMKKPEEQAPPAFVVLFLFLMGAVAARGEGAPILLSL